METTQALTNTPPRFDIYAGIHKALRAFMSDTLIAAARMDVDDEAATRSVLQQVCDLADFCLSHLEHENDFIHAAMEQRRPGSAANTAGDHIHHQHACEQLHQMAGAVEDASGATRGALARELARYLAVFVGENFLHMNVEETDNNAVLQATHTDAELLGLQQSIIASLTPQEVATSMRWMIPAVSHAERVGMLSGMRATAPAAAFEGVLAIAQAHLSARDWEKLEAALGLPQRLAA